MKGRAGLVGFLVLLGAGWGLTGVLAKIAIEGGHRHFGMIFWQMVISALVLGALTYLRGKRPGLGRRQIAFYLFIALTGTVLPNAAGYTALERLPAGVQAITIAAVPMFAFPIALLLRNESFRLMRLAGLGVGLAGVALLVAPETSLPPGVALWVPVALIAPLLYGIEGNVVAKWGTAGLDPIQALFGASVLGACLSLPLALGTGAFIDPTLPWNGADWALIGSSTIHALVYSGYVWLVGRAGPSFAAQVSYLVTGFGVLWAMALLGENYSGWVWAALGLMMLGLFLVQPRESRLPEAPARA
ncbi:DMT family transporter [Aliiroseovarius sp.]|uniref:DMT family transporter n=1 Tax=Aliiroseovarius sp. TaxID=1872442 RepID=UPI002609335F|nr:DMT family transporter [Aliiroseovarius sp.]